MDSSEEDSVHSSSELPTSAPSSPPPASASPDGKFDSGRVASVARQEAMMEVEAEARLENENAEEARRKAAAKKRKKKSYSKADREEKAQQLDDLLQKSQVFSDILTKNSDALGKVGSGADGVTLGEHDLILAEQPKSMVGGTMHEYQLEGLRWMQEICWQGVSGILADEMGLGKTIQTISLMAFLREEGHFGPHMIVAPLSTLSNWMLEFNKWAPSIPVVMYHGNPAERQEIRDNELFPNISNRRPKESFPIVCTSYEIILRDLAQLSRIPWEFVIVDEGHRMKNFNAKLFGALRSIYSDTQTRFLITGTPLQNTLQELWSLLHFLMPRIFHDWHTFEMWFDFSDDLADEAGTRDLIADQEKKSYVQKIHRILQPLLLRRVKADVAAYLPKKREYVLFAPMTKDQTDLYKVLQSKDIDTREYLENKVIERLNDARAAAAEARTAARTSKRKGPSAKGQPKSTPAPPKSLPLRVSPRKNNIATPPATPATSAFDLMMGKTRKGRTAKANELPTPVSTASKRKEAPTAEELEPKSARSSRHSTPSVSSRTSRKGRKGRGRPKYVEAGDDEDEDKLDDFEFEEKLAREMAASPDSDSDDRSADEVARQETVEAAKKAIGSKKLGNTLMQLRLVCNSPHHFDKPWNLGTDEPVDERIVTASGKMLLLDRLLPYLFKNGHKVLIFSQFNIQLDILEDYCDLRGWNACRIDGSVPQSDRAWQIAEFNKNPEFRLFLLSTRAGGQGINLAAADTVILFDSDWNPQQDLQAQDRAHRIGQVNPVIVYRFATKGTVEEQLLLNADAKRRLEKLVIKKGGFKSMGQKLDANAELDTETLRSLLLKDGMVYELSGKEDILSDRDLDVLCDRSDEAYAKAAKGAGNADAYHVVETGVDGIKRTESGDA